MYAGTTIGNSSGNLLGVHQRIDRIARRQLQPLLKESIFPSERDILYFEGNHGPDAVKRKSPSVDEPWHFLDPKKPEDRTLLDFIRDHRINLAEALRTGNQERAAFEAAWLAHAIVDGLTPAHHYPLADKIEELFGKPHHERNSVRDKNLIKGNSRRDTIAKNWEYWGSGGVFSTHALFEMGVATAIVGQRYKDPIIRPHDIRLLKKEGYDVVFDRILRQIIHLETYEEFTKKGWTAHLTRVVRQQLMPLIIKAVILGWYSAIIASKEESA